MNDDVPKSHFRSEGGETSADVFTDVQALLARVAELLDVHRLAEAERLLEPLVNDTVAIAALPPASRCRVLLEWGWIHGATQRYGIARDALAAAVQLAEHLRPRDLLCEALRESGVVAKYMGDFRAADTMLERSGQVAREEGYDLDLGQTLFLRATVAHLTGEFPRARQLLIEAIGTAERIDGQGVLHAEVVQLRADIRREQAVSARMARDFDGARQLLTQALTDYHRIGRRVGAANVERELGAVLAQIGDESAARDHYAAAFTGYLRANRRMGAALVARRLGQLDLVVGVEATAIRRRARRRLAQALRLGDGEPTNRALATLHLGTAARMDGDLDAAEEFLQDAIRQYDAMEPGPGVVRGLSQVAMGMGMIARERGDSAAAIALLRQALDTLSVTDDPSAASLVHYHLATELIKVDEVEEATRHAVAGYSLNENSGRRLGDPAERRSFYQTTRDSYGLALHCAARSGDGRTALAIATSARSEALAAFLRAGARFTPHLDDLIQEITLTAAESVASGESGPVHARLQDLYRRLERESSRQMRQTIKGGADVEEMIAALPPGGHALVLDVLEEDDTYCTRIWVTPDGDVHVDEVILPSTVRRFLDEYHQAPKNAAWRMQQEELAALGRAVVPGGLAAALSRAANPPLIISTGSVLGPMPVAALIVNGRYLAETAQLALVPSLALWPALRTRSPRTGSGVLAYLDPGVSGSRREEAALREVFAPVHVLGPAELLGRLGDASGYAAVVVSAHGTEPSRHGGPSEHDDHQPYPGLAQGLLLESGEQLTAAQLLRCKLPDAFITPSCWSGRLAVRTAVEPLGLPTAALLAGARWVLAGTVDIGGTTTATLLSRFYRQLAAGQTPAAALQRVQVDYVKQRTLTTPGTWAGLTLIGDGFGPLPAAGRESRSE